MSDPLRYKNYFGQYNGDFENRREITTYDNMMAEYAGIKGIPLEYYPINVDDYEKKIDIVYGETSTPKWDKKHILVGIIEDFSEEMQAFSKFNIENIDEITLYIHRTTFDEIVGIRSNKTPKKTRDRRGAWGPIASDLVMTPHNGLVYEVLNGGLHFLAGEQQHFGHKFWYKLTCKVRQTSDAPMGEGEQYGAVPDPILGDEWKGNPQFILPSPSFENLVGTGTNASGTPPTSSMPPEDPSCVGGDYSTIGTASGPLTGTPSDLLLPDGRISDKYKVQGAKDGSNFNEAKDVENIANEVIDPQTDQPTEEGSPEHDKYGPNGRVIINTRELFGDW